MPAILPAGPYRTLLLENGTTIPFYIIPFDEDGCCFGPLTRRHLIEHAGGYSDIFLFSHGWNHDWKVATKLYESFIAGFMKMRHDQGIPVPQGYKPLLVGIFWPNAMLVGRDENSPPMASTFEVDAAIAADSDAIGDIARRLRAQDRERFYQLAQSDALDEAETLDLARLLQPLYVGGKDELDAPPPESSDLIAAWKAGAAMQARGGADSDIKAASFIGKIRHMARNAIRGTTVWMMKERAGVIGARGVCPLLMELLATGKARVHLIGHCYGGKVMLSALSEPLQLPRNVHSMLLLQPAVSHLCFADRVPPQDCTPGGYRVALERVDRPILTTFSSKDLALMKSYHLAMLRGKTLGEMETATSEPPTRFAALGAFGPRRAGEKIMDMQLPPACYTFDASVPIYGLRGDATISDHGNISNASTWWALHHLVRN